MCATSMSASVSSERLARFSDYVRESAGSSSYRWYEFADQSRPANDGDQLAERPLLDEVFTSVRTQGDTHSRLGTVNVTDHRRLDLPVFLGKADQHDVTDHEPLCDEIDRHQPILNRATPRSTARR